MKKRFGFYSSTMVGLIAVTLMLSATLIYYLRDLLLSPDRISSIMGPHEGYYWTAAQYQIAYLQFQNQAILYASGRDKEIEKLRLRYAILQSKFKVLADSPELTHFFRQLSSYDASIRKLKKVMARLDRDMRLAEHDPRVAQSLMDDMQDGWRLATAIANNTRAAEMQHRECVSVDFYAKRNVILINGAILLLSAATVAILLTVFRRQRIALNAKHQALKAKNAFLAVVSHELRTPLQSITAAVDVLVDDAMSPRHGKLLRRLESASRQLETQMKDLTDYVQLEAGRLKIRRAPFMLHEIVGMAINDALPFAERKGLSLECSKLPKDAWYISDPQRIMQILSNLLTNAIKYTKEGGVVLNVDGTRMADGHDALVFRIADTGEGIPQDKLLAVFEPFMQVDQSSTRHHSGIGMGLTIAKGLVNLLGGTITVDSKVGHGTVLCVTIPAEVHHHQALVSKSPAPQWSGAFPYVLVVEDNESAGEAFAVLLDKLGVGYDIATGADLAMRLLNQRRYDALLLDIEMPVKDGGMVARELRAEVGINQHVPIIAVSAHADLVVQETKHLFDVYLNKPVRLETLRETLHKIFVKMN